jgi:periplasmic protein TonB
MKLMSLAVIVSCLAIGPAAANAQQDRDTQVYKPGNGVSAPVAVKEAKPRYTAEARKAGTEGTVLLECVVETDGTVGDVEVTRSLDEGLDQEAVKAARQWRFEPGKKDGQPVRVRITLEMTFSLK